MIYKFRDEIIPYSVRPTFPQDYEEQKKALLENNMVREFIELRKARRIKDANMPFYHYTNAFGALNDPNGLCYWNGYWHLFYQQLAYFSPAKRTVYWGHAVSKDFVKWFELPYAIYPSPEGECWSGSTCVEKDKVSALYYGYGGDEGLYCAVSSDPLLLNWEKVSEGPVVPKDVKNLQMPHCHIPEEVGALKYNVFDPCIWKDGDSYFALTGGVKRHPISGSHLRGEYLHTSKDLINWEYVKRITEDSSFTEIGDDGACPYFLPIDNDKHLYLYYSHEKGARYLLGKYDRDNMKFSPINGGKMNSTSQRGGYCAPSGCSVADGSVRAIYVMHSESYSFMSLPQKITVGGYYNNDEICIQPAFDLSPYRIDENEMKNIELRANEEKVLDSIRGNAMEMEISYSNKTSSCLEMRILRSDSGDEYTSICIYPERGNSIIHNGQFPRRHVVSVDCANSTKGDRPMSPPEVRHIFTEKDEPLNLHVFIDKCVVEVYINNKEVIGRFVCPDAESKSVSFISHGRDTVVDSVKAYNIMDVNGTDNSDIF